MSTSHAFAPIFRLPSHATARLLAAGGQNAGQTAE